MNGTIQSTIIGTIVADPEPFYKITEPDKPAGCNIRLAVNRSFMKDGAWQNKAQFVTVKVYGFKAQDILSDRCRWCRKGYHAWFVCEQLEETFIGKDGKEYTRPRFDYLMGKPILTGDSKEKSATQQNQQKPAPAPAPSPVAVDDIPF